ncbi:MAG TPA: ABC transporter permease [Armatimonadaceae bacterium]|nr:ABC transporter permease [Armatimonadaceae bacterium]
MSSSVFAAVTSHRELVENLVLRDVKSRYKQSILGYAWAITSPLVLAVIYWLVFGIFLQQRSGNIPFPVYAYFGLLFWNLFHSGMLQATESLVMHINLITKVYFPREVFPISGVLSKTVDFAFGLVGLIPILILFRVVPSVGALLIVPLVAIQLLFTFGLGMLTACANLFLRDVRYIVTLLLGLWVYLVPNMYPLEMVPPQWQRLYLLNPIATLTETARRATFPQTGEIAPLLPYVGIAAAQALFFFVVGYIVFKRNEARFAESI